MLQGADARQDGSGLRPGERPLEGFLGLVHQVAISDGSLMVVRIRSRRR